MPTTEKVKFTYTNGTVREMGEREAKLLAKMKRGDYMTRDMMAEQSPPVMTKPVRVARVQPQGRGSVRRPAAQTTSSGLDMSVFGNAVNTTPVQPPVDNKHVAHGAEQFGSGGNVGHITPPVEVKDESKNEGGDESRDDVSRETTQDSSSDSTTQGAAD